MSVSLKCQYALRALFVLAQREGEGSIRIPEIAEEQDIPPRYLENIFNQMRQGGFVESRRGKGGGFFLARSARDISVGDIVRFIEGPIHPTNCQTDIPASACRFKRRCAFIRLWDEAEKALENVYNNTSLKDLVEEEKLLSTQTPHDYSI